MGETKRYFETKIEELKARNREEYSLNFESHSHPNPKNDSHFPDIKTIIWE